MAYSEGEAEEKPPYSDDEMLTLVRTEMQRSVGFENDQTLRDERLRALDYYKGDMKSDIPSLPNRSKAVSTDIADAVETILTDVMDIFTGGNDIAAFIPTKQEDEEQAQQETDYLNHVLFQDNPGFLTLYTGFKDALLLKTAVFEFGWKSEYDDEDFTGKTAAELALAAQSGNVINVVQDKPDPDYPNTEQTFSFTVRTDYSCAEYWAIPPDDFSVSPDTIRITDATYCVARYRPRVQDLIADGYDKDAVNKLEPYNPVSDQQLQQARDNAGEHLNAQISDTTNDVLRQVEIRKHYLRLIDEDGDEDIWCVATNATGDVLIPRDGKGTYKVSMVPFAVGSPYLVAHRLYGKSLAEMLFEVQRIKTVLTRALLDSAYFAQNQRFEVAMDRANDYTISDLLRNEPMVPVRSKSGDALRPLQGPGLGFDAYQALEYFSTVAEMRTGVVRNAQGLNPDTLHDTAKGAMALMSAAQRRVRMIARVLAETCIKELYLGLHACIRENAESPRVVKLNGKWLPIDPTKWGERNAMTIEVGLGASGRDVELANMQIVAGLQKAAVELQGGAAGPLVKVDNLYNTAVDMTKKLGIKATAKYFSDPNDPNNPAPPPKPDPATAKVQGELQIKQAQMQADSQHQQATLQSNIQLEQMKIQSEQAIANAKAQATAATTQQQNILEHERAQAQQANQMALEQMKVASQERIAIETARINAEAKISAAMASAKIDQQTTLAYEQSHETETV